jgi:hypothetical protein
VYTVTFGRGARGEGLVSFHITPVTKSITKSIKGVLKGIKDTESNGNNNLKLT